MKSLIGVLNRFGSTLNCDARVKIFNAFIKPSVSFALPVWSNTGTGCMISMDRTLRHAARTICCNKAAELGKNLKDATSILPFRLLSLQSNCIRIFNAFATNSITYYLDSVNLHSSHETRSSQARKLVPVTHKKASDEVCFQCAAVCDWNALPFATSSSTSFKLFSSNLTKFIHNPLI